MTFGEKLKQLRIDNNMTQEELGRQIGIQKSGISKYENDTVEPNLTTLAKISKIFNVSIDSLVPNEVEILNAKPKNVGERLRHLRIEKNLTQEEFGKIFNMTKSRISQYETSKHEIDDKTKILFADYFNISIDYLLGRIEDRNIEVLSSEEKQLLLSFRKLSNGSQNEIFNSIKQKIFQDLNDH